MSKSRKKFERMQKKKQKVKDNTEKRKLKKQILNLMTHFPFSDKFGSSKNELERITKAKLSLLIERYKSKYGEI